MPIYEFICEDCGHPFEELLFSASAIDEVRCPGCDSTSIRKKLSLIASNTSKSAGPSTAAACTTST